VTGGTDTGAAGHVGEAIRDYSLSSLSVSANPVVAIGVANSDSVHHGQVPSHVTCSMQVYI